MESKNDGDPMELQDIGFLIGQTLRERRDILGITRGDFAQPLKSWNMETSSVDGLLTEFEKGRRLYKMLKKEDLGERFSDYLAVLGVSAKEKRMIKLGVKLLLPDWKLPKSVVKPYNGSNTLRTETTSYSKLVDKLKEYHIYPV